MLDSLTREEAEPFVHVGRRSVEGGRATHPSWERSGAARRAGKEIHGESGSHKALMERLREEGAGACRNGGDVGPRSTREGERGEGEETERPDEIGDRGRRRMGAAVMRRRCRARGRRWPSASVGDKTGPLMRGGWPGDGRDVAHLSDRDLTFDQSNGCKRCDGLRRDITWELISSRDI
jgi:hypothetical protein